MAVEGSEIYCYNTKGDRNSVISQLSCRMDVTHEMSKFTCGEAAFYIVASGLWKAFV
jgi:hypothetical protein